MANVTEMPAAEAPETPFDEPPSSETPTPKAEKRPGKPPKPSKPAAKPPEGRQPDFFARVAQVPTEDWGTRAYMYLYVEEPVCVANTWGKYSYAKKFYAPILDLEPIKEMYGSMKGWLSLNTRKSGKDATDQIDKLDFEIFDPHCPPKTPRGAWANDSRNIRWEALLPKEAKQPSESATSLLDSIKVYKEIRDEVKDEMDEPADEPGNRTRETLETMKLAKELFATPPATAPPAPPDPMDGFAKFMTLQLNMRAADPMLSAMLTRLEAADKAAEAARAREFELLKELRQQSATPAKGLVDQIVELAALGEKLKPLKDMLGLGGGIEATATRAVKTGAYDMLKDMAASPFGQQVGAGIGMLLGSLAQRGATANGQPVQQPQAPPIILNAQQTNGTAPHPETVEQRMSRIGQQVGYSMVYEYFLRDLDGGAFAEWMFDGMPEDTKFMQSLGAEDIVRRCRMVPAVWNVVAPKEPAFIEFIGEFCGWNQQAEDQPPASSEAKQEVEDELS